LRRKRSPAASNENDGLAIKIREERKKKKKRKEKETTITEDYSPEEISHGDAMTIPRRGEGEG